MKKTTISIICGLLAAILLSGCTLVRGNEMMTIYDENNNTKEVSVEEVSDYLSTGWFESPVIKIYSLDGRTLTIEEKFFNDYHAVGWYGAPVMQVWDINNNTCIIAEKDFADYHAWGWYGEPVTTVWDLQGNSYIVKQSEKDWYLKNKYYASKPEVNYSDMMLLARVIHAEATQNPALRILDRQCVGAVVMNRVRHPRFPNTVREVIYAPRQYGCQGTYWFNLPPPQECIDIAKQLLLGETFGVPANVVYQAQFRQGSGVWRTVGVHYYCYI